MPGEKPISHVFFFAHQDDEWGVLPDVARLARQGARVRCLFLTSGVREPDRAAQRDAESRAVLLGVGIGPDDILFLGSQHRIPSCALHHYLEDIFATASEALETCDTGTRFFVPAWEGGHPDHDATHLVGLAIAHRHDALKRTRQFPLYHAAGVPQPLFRVFAPLPANGPVTRNRFARLTLLWAGLGCVRYRSQWKSFAGLAPFGLVSRLIRGGIDYQPVSPARAASRPHDGPLLAETRFGVPFEEFQEDVRAFVNARIRRQG